MVHVETRKPLGHDPFLFDEAFVGFAQRQRERYRSLLSEGVYPLDALFQLVKDKPLTRRSVLNGIRKGALVLGAAVVGFDQGARIPENIHREPPEIIFEPDQQELLHKKDSPDNPKTAVIFIGAATVRDPSKFGTVQAVTPAFNAYGFPVGYLRCANFGLDPKGTAAQLEELKTKYGVKRIIGVFQSAGFQFVAEAFDLVGEDLEFAHGIFFSTPLNGSTTKFDTLTKIAKAIDPYYQLGILGSGAANIQRYGNPVKEGAAGPDLAFDQAVALADGEYLVGLYTPRVGINGTDNTEFSYITTDDPENDDIIYPVESREGLERVLGIAIPEYSLAGAGHADPASDPIGSQEVLRKIMEKFVENRKPLRR